MAIGPQHDCEDRAWYFIPESTVTAPQRHLRGGKWQDTWLSHGTGASRSGSPMHPTFTDDLDLWTSARALPSLLLPKWSDSTKIMQKVCGKGVSPEPPSFPSPSFLPTVLVLFFKPLIHTQHSGARRHSRDVGYDWRRIQGRNLVSVAFYTHFAPLGLTAFSAEQWRNRLPYHGTLILHMP